MVYVYDPGAGLIRTVIHLSYTVVPCTILKLEFWLFMGIHILVIYLSRTGVLKGADNKDSVLYVNWEGIHIVTTMTTFFEIFYTNQCYSRYVALYHSTRTMMGHIHDFTFEMRTHFGETAHQHTRVATRFLMASVLLFFFEMNAHVSEREWEELKSLALIDDDEKVFLEKLQDQEMSLVVLHWAASVARLGWLKSKAPANSLTSMLSKLLGVRGLQQALMDTLNLPVPFQYFHLLNMMVGVNLLLWAYGLGVAESIFSPVVFFFAQLIFMGMMELASQLSNPFGDDEVDFPVNTWLSQFLSTTMTLAEYRFPGAEDGWESALSRQDRLGSRFGAKSTKVNVFIDRPASVDSSRGDASLLSRFTNSASDPRQPSYAAASTASMPLNSQVQHNPNSK